MFLMKRPWLERVAAVIPVGGETVDDDTEWAYRFLMVDVRADADAAEQTAVVNAAWELIADELWSPQIVSFQAVPAGDYLSLVVLYRYDDSDDDDDDDDDDDE